MRILLYLPLIHTLEELGGLKGAVSELGGGDRVARAKQQLSVSEVWDKIEMILGALPVGTSGWRLYQDGLPICDRERAIVDELASGGSRNHQVLQQLIERGATLMGTESPELLIEEYQLQKQMLEGNEQEQRSLAEAAADILKRRDADIGARINQTLEEGEVGILFIGLMHDVEDYLDRDIKLRYPIGKPGSVRGHLTIK